MDAKFEMQVLLRHYWKQGFNATDAVRKINEVEGEGTSVIRTAQTWFKRFSEGNMSLERKEGSGRPSTVDPSALLKAVESNPQESARKLAIKLNLSKTTVVDHLHNLGKIYKRCQETPHDLTPAQIERRLNVCKDLLQNPQDMRFFRRIITCDEKIIYLRNPNTSKQWLSKGQSSLPVVKRGRFDKKVMLCVWWNYEGIIHFEVVPGSQMINAEYYTHQLERMYEKLKQKYPALVNRKRALLQQDNAKPHTAFITKKKLEELDGIELLKHPAYSPDLAPSDYHLFRAMAHFLKGRNFDDIQDVEKGCQDFFSSKTKEWYRRGIEQLVERWMATVDHNGLYFQL